MEDCGKPCDIQLRIVLLQQAKGSTHSHCLKVLSFLTLEWLPEEYEVMCIHTHIRLRNGAGLAGAGREWAKPSDALA